MLPPRGMCIRRAAVDRTDSGGKHIDLPCVGVFEMDGGKIRCRRELFRPGNVLRGR